MLHQRIGRFLIIFREQTKYVSSELKFSRLHSALFEALQKLGRKQGPYCGARKNIILTITENKGQPEEVAPVQSSLRNEIQITVFDSVFVCTHHFGSMRYSFFSGHPPSIHPLRSEKSVPSMSGDRIVVL